MDQNISPQSINEINELIDSLKNRTRQFENQQESLLATYSKIITALNQTQEAYGESLKFFIQRLQSDAKPIQDVNVSLTDLLNTAALFGGKVSQTSKQVESLAQIITGIENNLTAWSTETKTEIKNIHQQASISLFRKMKIFILINSAGVIGMFITILYFFYRTGLFN